MPQSNKVHLKVQQRSGFDKSHYHDLTTNVGTLTPVLTDELIPNSDINLNVAASVTLPPLASDAFAKLDLKLEAFAVPHRILYSGFEKWFSDSPYVNLSGDDTKYSERVQFLPSFTIGSNWDETPQPFRRRGLGDYLGLKLADSYYQNTRISLMPFLAYAKVYEQWYRAPLVQEQLFSDASEHYSGDSAGVSELPFVYDRQYSRVYEYGADNFWMYFVDGSTIFDLRQRNYGFDYFTNAWPSLQFGSAMSVETDANGKFTIAALRAANSLQQFEERNSFAPLYYQAVHARYGGRINSAIVQRPVFLGSATIPIKTYGVDVTADNMQQSNRNPFATMAGAQLGRAHGEGFVNLIDNYHTDEPCYIMVLASLVPRAVYSSGVSRIFDRYTRVGGLAEMANPLLQNTGNQPIYSWELDGCFATGHDNSFGYTDRFADWMTCPDRISGELREGGSLEAFVLKRDFEGTSTGISSSFLKIPTSALNEISAAEDAISNYGAWMQFGFDYKVVQPLALYSIPSLQDPAYEHGYDIEVYRGGFRF